ncbi:hypothetical protein [Rhodococcoides fascians]|uniref:hypothetical protein n=1 Tax=Rhodococcoides fascians TaxID=1828 RepID=UPI000568C60D|nr:hypothetical protein [Rhodococcus fascians]
MHDTSTEAQAETENGFAFAVENARVEALKAIKFHTIKAVLSTVAASTDTHTEQAAKWACLARQNGASEHEITDAEQDGLHFVRVFGDDGDDGEGRAWYPPTL